MTFLQVENRTRDGHGKGGVSELNFGLINAV